MNTDGVSYCTDSMRLGDNDGIRDEADEHMAILRMIDYLANEEDNTTTLTARSVGNRLLEGLT